MVQVTVKLPTSGPHANLNFFFRNARNVALNPKLIVVFVVNVRKPLENRKN